MVEMSDDRTPTPIRCRGCDGRVGLFETCRWCAQTGWMSPEQLGTWMRYKSGPRSSAAPPTARSTQPYDSHQIVVMDRLARAWGKARDMNLGELLLEALAFQHMAVETLATLDDKRLAEIVEHYILLGR
jgi:hypothetical protein